MDEWDPQTGQEMVSLVTKFQQTKLEDPKMNVTDWLTDLSWQRAKLKRLKYDINDTFYMTHVMANLPMEYTETVSSMQIELRKNNLDLKEMRTRLKDKYSQMKMLNGWSEDEIALAAVFKPFDKKNNFTKKFKGMCRSCGKVGHKSPDCWEKEENKGKRPHNYKSGNSNGSNSGGIQNNHNGGRFSGKCHKCGKTGHKSFQCRSSGNDEQANNAGEIQEHVMMVEVASSIDWPATLEGMTHTLPLILHTCKYVKFTSDDDSEESYTCEYDTYKSEIDYISADGKDIPKCVEKTKEKYSDSSDTEDSPDETDDQDLSMDEDTSMEPYDGEWMSTS